MAGLAAVCVYGESSCGWGRESREVYFLQKDRILCAPLHQNAKNSAVKFSKVVNASSLSLGLVGKRGEGEATRNGPGEI